MNRSASPLNAPAEMPPGTPGSKPTLLNLTIHAELIQLLFAARDLAEAQIEPAGSSDLAFCGECLNEEAGGRIAHAALCKTGRVMGVIAALSNFNSNRKEAAETGCAGDGIRLRTLSEMVCQKCNGRGGIWDAQAMLAAPKDWPGIGLNQVWGAGLAGDQGGIVYTHRCAVDEGGAR